MDVKEARVESALAERSSDGAVKYAQGALHYDRNKSFHDIGPSSYKMDSQTSRPCAVIGPDRVVQPPVAHENYLKKTVLEPWPSHDNTYRRPPDYPHKMSEYQDPTRNISPRQTFQENMQRIIVPPGYSSGKLNEDPAYASKKLNLPSDAKYCDVPYTVTPINGEQKNIKNATNVNPMVVRSIPHGWQSSAGINVRPSRAFVAPELYQYSEYPSCAGPRPAPLTRTHATVHEDPAQLYPEPCYEGNIRFKPYPNIKERYPPQTRYEYLSNYSHPFPPPHILPTHKYDMQKSVPLHAYPGYPQPLKYNERITDHLDGYQRPFGQPPPNYGVPFRGPVIHPTYRTGNSIQNKLHVFSTDGSNKSAVSNKLPYDPNSKIYLDYENSRTNKNYPMPDNYYVNDMPRPYPAKNQPVMANYPPVNVHGMTPHHYYRKDNIQMRNYEYASHFKNMDPSLMSHPLARMPSQFSPNTIAISPTDSNTSNDTMQTLVNPQEDCGYVSQSSVTSIRSLDSLNRIPVDPYGRYDYRYGPAIRPPPLSKSDSNCNKNAKSSKQIDVRQFLQSWSEGDDENENSAVREKPKTVTNDIHNFPKQYDPVTNQELYVLGLVNVPSEELGKYEHIQKVSKLPEHIKGYNSLELLNQFEEAIESSNVKNDKPATPRNLHMPTRALVSQHETLPRAVSPLDVEAKISQSVIHKDVGCNFEIKPCSPKMLNVETAAPVQTIFNERVIEKVANPHSVKSPLVLHNTDQNLDKIFEKSIKYPLSNSASSCKMINGQTLTEVSSIDSSKTNYSLQDLESNSGVCLASLPRLDNDIELSFPEVNQQFINANKNDSVITTSYSTDLPPLDADKSHNNHKDKSVGGGEYDINYQFSPKLEIDKELSRLSKYRKLKKNATDEKNISQVVQATRVNSVIIKNPDNIKTSEEKVEIGKASPSHQRSMHETQEFAMDLAPISKNAKTEMTNETDNINTESKILSNVNENPKVISNTFTFNSPETKTDDKYVNMKTNQNNEFEQSSNRYLNTTSLTLPMNLSPQSKNSSYNIDDEYKNNSNTSGIKQVECTASNTVPDEHFNNVCLQEDKKDSEFSAQKLDLTDSLLEPLFNKCETNVESCTQSKCENFASEISEIKKGYLDEYMLNTSNSGCTSDEPSCTKQDVNKQEENSTDYKHTDYSYTDQVESISNTGEEQHESKLTHREETISLKSKINSEVRKMVSKLKRKKHVTSRSGSKSNISEYNSMMIFEDSIIIQEKRNLHHHPLSSQSYEQYSNKESMPKEDTASKNMTQQPALVTCIPNSVETNDEHATETQIQITDDKRVESVNSITDKTLETNSQTEEIKIAQDNKDNAGSNIELEIEERVVSSKNIGCELIEPHMDLSDVIRKPENQHEDSVLQVYQELSKHSTCSENTFHEDLKSNTELVSKMLVPINTTIHDETAATDIKINISNESEDYSTFDSNENDKDVIQEHLTDNSISLKNSDDPCSIQNVTVGESNICNEHKMDMDMEESDSAESDVCLPKDDDDNILNTSMENKRVNQVESVCNNMSPTLTSEIHDPLLREHKDTDSCDEISTNSIEVNEISAEPEKASFSISSTSDNETHDTETCNENVLTTEDEINSETKCDYLPETTSFLNCQPVILPTDCMDQTLINSKASSHVDDLSKSSLSKKYFSKELFSPQIKMLLNYAESCDSLEIRNNQKVAKIPHKSKAMLKCNFVEMEQIENAKMDTESNSYPGEIDNTNKSESSVLFTADMNVDSNICLSNKSTENCEDDHLSFADPEDCVFTTENITCVHKNVDSFPSETNSEADDNCDKNDSVSKDEPDIDNTIASPDNDFNDEAYKDIPKASLSDDINQGKNMNCLEKEDISVSAYKNRFPLKRSFSDSALDSYDADESLESRMIPKKRKKIRDCSNIHETHLLNIIQNSRRNSISAMYNENNFSLCILIDNDCIIADENFAQEESTYTHIDDCLGEIQEDKDVTVNNMDHIELKDDNDDVATENMEEKSWEETSFDFVETDDIAENVVIGSPTSEKDTDSSDYESGDEDLCDLNIDDKNHTEKVKHIYGDNMCINDAQLVDALYRTPQMDVNKKLMDKESQNAEKCNKYYDSDSLEMLLAEPNDCGPVDIKSNCVTPNHLLNPDALNENIPDNKENVNIKYFEDTPLREGGSYINVDAEKAICSTRTNETQDDTVHSCESSMDNVSYYSKKDDTNSSSPEVSSTTSEDKSTSTLLKIVTSNKNSSVPKTKTTDIRKGDCCKFTEKDYLSPNNDRNTTTIRPLITKAAQKYIPPLKETIPDLKVKLTLPQQSLIKLKKRKVSKEESKINNRDSSRNVGNLNPKRDIPKKIKPKFEDVLKSLDEIQLQMHKEKNKKPKKFVPKVVIKKNENGSHYASTSTKDSFNPDLTGRKWQPWVFIEKNHFVDKMASRKKTKAIFSHRKNSFVIADKFRKYKSINSAKFVISQPKLHDLPTGNLKYTIKLKHNY